MAILSFAHKGLKKFVYTGVTTGIVPTHAKRLREITDNLAQPYSIRMRKVTFPSIHSVRLKFQQEELFAVRVDASWRVLFSQKKTGHVYNIDYQQYH